MERKLKDVKEIVTYDCAWNVLENYGDGETEKRFPEEFNFSDDDIIFLQSFDDYEYLQYMIVDSDHFVLIRNMDDRIICAMPYTEFYAETMRMLDEDRENRQ